MKPINIFSFLRRHYYVIVVLLLGLISLTWYRDKDLLWGDDTNITLDVHLIKTRYFYLWDSNLGKADPLKLPYIMPQAIIMRIVAFFNIPFSPAIFERILLYSVLIGSGLSMYYLSVLFIPSEKRKRLGALMASVFYMFNFYMMTTILPSGAMIMFEYAFFPLVLALYIKALDNFASLKRSILIALVWTLLITPAYITATVALTDWIVILAYFLFYNMLKHDKKTLKSSAVFTGFLLAIWILLNLFWILPLAQGVQVVQQSYSSFSSNIELYATNSVSLLNGLRLTGYWGLTATLRGSSYYPWYTHFQTLPFVLISFLLPVIVGISLLLNSRKSRHVLFFGIIILPALFVVKGLNPPLGNVNQWLFSINLLSTTFRSSYQRTVGYLTLSYAFLMGAFVGNIYRRPKRIWCRDTGRMFTTISLMLLVVGALAWPIWTGDVFSTEGIFPSKRVKVPQYYYEAAEWLDQQNEDFSVLPFPYPANTAYSVLWWKNGTEGYYGTYPFLLLSSKTFLLTNNLAEEAALSFSRNELRDSQVLNYLNVKYVVVHWDTNWEYVRDHDWWVSTSPQNLSARLANVQGLSLEKSFGEIDFYRNLYWKPQKAQTISKAEYLNTSLSSLVPILGMGAFEKRMEISVQTENAASAVDLVIPLNISYQDGISPDFGNVLFTYFNETSGQETKLFHWIEENKINQSAVIWIKVPAFDKNGNCRLFLYYGGNITQKSNPEIFFRFYDYFENRSFSKWNIAESGWSFDDSQRTEGESSAKGTGGPTLLVSNIMYTENAVYERYFKFGENSMNHYVFVSSDDIGGWNYWIVAKQDGKFGYFDGQDYKDYPIVTPYTSGIWYNIRLSVSLQEQKYWVWINSELVTPFGIPTKNDHGRNGNILVNWRLLNTGSEQNGTMWIDAVAVKNPIGTDFHYNIVKVQSLWSSSSNNITCVKNNPTEYYINANITEPSYLIFCEPFEDGWTIDGNPDTFKHILAFDSLNRWSIDASGNYSIAVVYGPQRNLEFGLIISIVTFVAGSVFLLAYFRRSFLSRIWSAWTSRLFNIIGNVHDD